MRIKLILHTLFFILATIAYTTFIKLFGTFIVEEKMIDNGAVILLSALGVLAGISFIGFILCSIELITGKEWNLIHKKGVDN